MVLGVRGSRSTSSSTVTPSRAFPAPEHIVTSYEYVNSAVFHSSYLSTSRQQSCSFGPTFPSHRFSDEHSSSGPRNSHHLCDGKRRVSFRISIPAIVYLVVYQSASGHTTGIMMHPGCDVSHTALATVTLLWKELYTNGTPERVPFVSSRGNFKFIALFQTARIEEGTRWESAEIALIAPGTELSPLSRLCEPESLSVEMELFTLRLCSRLPSMPAVPSSRELSVIRVDQHRPHHPLKSSPFSLIRSCCCGVSQRFHPPGKQSSLCFDGPMIRELMALVSLDFWSLHVDFAGCPQCGVHPAQKSELRAHQMARMCDLPHAEVL